MNYKFIAKSNFLLRKVLNSNKTLDILKDFIESVLKIRIEEIFLNKYLYKKARSLPTEENFGIADVRIKTEDGEEMNVGIQFIDGMYIQTKLLLYYAQIHGNQLEYDEDRKIAKTNTINILDFVLNKDLDYHSRMIVSEGTMTNVINDYLEIHILQLPKFQIEDSENITLKQAWMSYLKGENSIEAIKKSKQIKKLDWLLEKYWKEEVME